MNLFSNAILFIALVGSASAQNKDNGVACTTSVEIDCIVKGGDFDGRPCEDLILAHCAEQRIVQYSFTYCNKNSQAIDLRAQMTNPKIDNVEVSEGFNKSKMPAGECRTVKKNVEYNTCLKGQAAAGMTLNAWIEGFEQVNTHYCYSYDFKKYYLRIRNPTGAPDIPQYDASVDLTILTEFEPYPGFGYVHTDHLSNYPPNKSVDCVKTFRTIYSITNDGPIPVKVGGLVGNNNSDLLTSEQKGEELSSGDSLTAITFEDINICERHGDVIVKRATAVAADLDNPSRNPGVDADMKQFQIP